MPRTRSSNRHGYVRTRKSRTKLKAADRKQHYKEYKRQYSKSNRERLNRYLRDWRKKHPGYNAPYQKKYVAKLKALQLDRLSSVFTLKKRPFTDASISTNSKTMKASL